MEPNYNNAAYVASYGTAAQLPKSTLPEIAFSGKSNVGKSSLMNTIFARKSLVKVSSKPGKTTTINFFSVGGVYFCDLPGYGYAKVAEGERKRWATMMEHYFTSGRDIRLCVQLLDMRHSPTADDRTMLGFLKETGIPYLIVLTKSDKLNKTERQNRLLKLKEELAFLGGYPQPIPFSALNREGLDEVKAAIAKSL